MQLGHQIPASRQLFAEGKVGRDALLESEAKSYHAEGTCTFYGTANSKVTSADITDKSLAESLHIDDLGALTGPTVHLQSYNPDRAKVLAAWQQVKAS